MPYPSWRGKPRRTSSRISVTIWQEGVASYVRKFEEAKTEAIGLAQGGGGSHEVRHMFAERPRLDYSRRKPSVLYSHLPSVKHRN